MTHSPADSRLTDAPSLVGMGIWNGETLLPLKIVLIAVIVLATIIPNLFTIELITERETRQADVEHEFKRVWGPAQHLYSPILVVPFRSPRYAALQYLKLTPTNLEVAANLLPQERKRGWFHATVYNAKIDMQGSFLVADEARLRDLVSDQSGDFLWNESFVAFGTAAHLTGLSSEDRIVINGADTPWQPCVELIRDERPCSGASLVLAKAHADAGPVTGKVSFKLAASLRGTTSFNVLYGGKTLDVTIRSSWPTPSFQGDVLPLTSSVTSQGFEAHWQTAEFGSPRISTSSVIADPALWKGVTIGADLIEATPVYRMVNRVAKYGLLFVVLSFATYVFFELLSRVRIHLLQYGMLGLSLSLFSLLLLSLSEPIGYTAGYVASAGLVLIQSTLYTAAVTRRAAPALVFAGMLASVFAFLHVLLGLESYALVTGALALFVVVSALMALTQTVDWSAVWHTDGSETRSGRDVPTSA